jgi:hypothetical protein
MIRYQPKHGEEGPLFFIQVFFKAVLKLKADPQQGLRSSKDFCYAFHRRGDSF